MNESVELPDGREGEVIRETWNVQAIAPHWEPMGRDSTRLTRSVGEIVIVKAGMKVKTINAATREDALAILERDWPPE